MTDKQKRFCEEYLLDLNAAQAAIRAGYSKNTAKEQGHQLLNNPSLEDYIQKLLKNRSEKLEIDADYVLSKLKSIAEANIADYLNFKGQSLSWKDFDELTKEQLEAIESVKETKYGIEIKLHGKSWTLDMIAKHIGFFERDNQQKGERSVKFSDEVNDLITPSTHQSGSDSEES